MIHQAKCIIILTTYTKKEDNACIIRLDYVENILQKYECFTGINTQLFLKTFAHLEYCTTIDSVQNIHAKSKNVSGAKPKQQYWFPLL